MLILSLRIHTNRFQFQSRILIDEIAEDKVFERKDRFSLKTSIVIIKNIYMNKIISIRLHKCVGWVEVFNKRQRTVHSR